MRNLIKKHFLSYFSVCQGKPVAIENWHMTLAFLGMVEEESMPCYQQAASGLAVSPFTLQLDSCGYFKRAGVAWLSCRHVPAELRQLVDSLQDGIPHCGFQREARPWQAHMTLVRKARHAPLCQPAGIVDWPVSDFCLVESRTCAEGVQYQVLQRWPLSSG